MSRQKPKVLLLLLLLLSPHMPQAGSEDFYYDDWCSIVPAFNFEDYDIVIRSGGLDEYDYRVHKLILKHSSEVWSTMLSLPGNGMTVRDDSGVPIMQLPEEGRVIDDVLRLIYPLEKPEMDSFRDIALALEMAAKYEISVAVQQLGQALLTHGVVDQYPLRVFSLAVRYGLDDVKEAAYQRLLTFDFMSVAAATEAPELSSLTALEYHLLCQKKRARSKAALEIVNTAFGGHKLLFSCFANRHSCCGTCWFNDYHQLVVDRLVDNASSSALFFHDEELAQFMEGICAQCGPAGFLKSFFLLQKCPPFKDVVKKIDALS